jgi:arylsulfatase A
MGEKAAQNERHFAEMTAFMDKLVGQLDERLAELGLRDNTLLLFLGDNGTGGGVRSKFQDREIRGGKGTTAWRGTRVPLIASWPAVIREGKINRDLVSSVDFLPTICEAAGIPAPVKTDGVSFLPQLRGERGAPREWLYHWYSPRQNNAKRVTEFAFDHRYKLYRDGRFFDLERDPEEKSPMTVGELSGDMAKSAGKLDAALERFRNARPMALDAARAPDASRSSDGE